jgi:hypothetical protein
VNDEYERFLAGKRKHAPEQGFEIAPDSLNPNLFPFQAHIVSWACRLGRAAIFSECGTGKTLMELAWSQAVYERTNKDVLNLAPLAVAAQTKREGEKFGIPVTVCRSQKDVRPGVNIANYEMLEHFDPERFVAVVLDESAILKNFMGKTKQRIISAFARTPFRLACTAVPSPNDFLELGNQAAFLGIMPANEMIMRWFINDTMEAGAYRLKRHGENDFWRWVSSWAIALDKPSDIGYSDDGFILPPLEYVRHIVSTDHTVGAAEDQLFRSVSLSATTLHREMRITCEQRAAKVAEIVASSGPNEAWPIWCNTNYEADALKAAIPEAIEIRGNESVEAKESKLMAFSSGQSRLLITKGTITGFGMNWQHSANSAFVGLSYSFEQLYQAVRRNYRYGQTRPVFAHIVMADTETAILDAVRRKERDHTRMKAAMIQAMRETQLSDISSKRLVAYAPTRKMEVPNWLNT